MTNPFFFKFQNLLHEFEYQLLTKCMIFPLQFYDANYTGGIEVNMSSIVRQASISILGSSGGALNGFVVLGAFFPTCNRIVSTSVYRTIIAALFQ